MINDNEYFDKKIITNPATVLAHTNEEVIFADDQTEEIYYLITETPEAFEDYTVISKDEFELIKLSSADEQTQDRINQVLGGV